MTYTVGTKVSSDGFRKCTLLWDKEGFYYVEATEKASHESAVESMIRRSKRYPDGQRSNVNRIFKRYCEKYL